MYVTAELQIVRVKRSLYLAPSGTYSSITDSAVTLHCCKAHSKINGKMENSTLCKMVIPENFILKLGTRYYVDRVTHCTISDVDRFSGGFSPNR